MDSDLEKIYCLEINNKIILIIIRNNFVCVKMLNTQGRLVRVVSSILLVSPFSIKKFVCDISLTIFNTICITLVYKN